MEPGMMDLNEAIQIFRDSEGQTEVMLRKAECAKEISKALVGLKLESDIIWTNIECEVAVMETQKIVNK
jgi:hypothetical protein